MNESAAVHPHATSITNRFNDCNHGCGRRRRPVAFPRLLVSVLIIVVIITNLCFWEGMVVAHSMDRYTQTQTSSSNNNDQRGRRRSYKHHSRLLYDRLGPQFSLAEECYKLSKPCNSDYIVGGICGIRGGGVSEYDNHNVDDRNFFLRKQRRRLSSFRCCEMFLRIQRGGANRFVDDDKNDYKSNVNNNNDETVGIGAYDKRNGKHSPVVYQYFGRSRSRGGQSYQSQADDAPLNFILLGPNVDHWKTVGQTLASRGFNVMACERMVKNQQRKNGGNDSDSNADYEGASNYEDAPELVLEILDALKWNKAVIVGCDDESLLAMETAMMLAPDRVAGLILCGDLMVANQFAKETGGVRVLDSFLHRVLDCPFVIVWDGGARSIVSGSSAHEAIETKSSPFDGDGVDGRCVILGGGSAPHRTKPEYFAWVLARFVEEKLEFHSMDYVGGKRRSTMPESSMEENDHMKARQNRGGILQNLNLPFGIHSLVSPEGRLLLGRAVAAAIFYTSVMKIIFVQYGILRLGWISIKNSVDSVDALRRKIFQVTGAFIWNFGYVPRLFKFSLKRTKELDEDEISSNNSKLVPAESPEGKENDESTSDSLSTSFDEYDTDDTRKEDEDEDNEDTFRNKPLFFLDNIFT